jgi:hypothetical protein
MTERNDGPPVLGRPSTWDDMYPGTFMRGTSIPEGNKPIVTITDVQLMRLPDDKTGGEKTKGVLSFREVELKLALNKTNGLCLKQMFGDVPEHWVGKRIVLHRVKFKGEPAVRVFGSPDIQQNITFMLKLPKKAAQEVTLYAPNKKPASNEKGPQQ